jgi:hypothetical protein
MPNVTVKNGYHRSQLLTTIEKIDSESHAMDKPFSIRTDES